MLLLVQSRDVWLGGYHGPCNALFRALPWRPPSLPVSPASYSASPPFSLSPFLDTAPRLTYSIRALSFHLGTPDDDKIGFGPQSCA